MTKESQINGLDLSNITSERMRNFAKKGSLNYLCSDAPELVPSFDFADCEVAFPDILMTGKKNHNHQIVFGRDRHGNWATGAGGKGLLQSGMIDLVAGRGHLIIQENIKKKNPDILEGVKKVGPMFHSDAARVYITQKSMNIDRYFGLEPGPGPDSALKSAVAIKADHLRFIGREKVKIYVGRGNWNGFSSDGETNCAGERIRNPVIEFKVGDQETHPMVLGNKLISYLKKKNKNERKILQQLFSINANLAALNTAVSLIPGAAAATGPMFKMIMENTADTVAQNLNTFLQELDSLDTDLGITGKNHILSNSVFTS
tara:strand:- start:119 stop:1066 length:948 start_codon:yes stop_codon:yes gene_type:complete